MKYNHKAVEEKWQKIWEDKGVFHASDDTEKEKFANSYYPEKLEEAMNTWKENVNHFSVCWITDILYFDFDSEPKSWRIQRART